ncbi:MAG: hypothetical protein AB8H86_13770 [Polyangiales bacterium]
MSGPNTLFLAALLALCACGTRSALLVELRDDAGDAGVGAPDASTNTPDARSDARGADTSVVPSECVWGPRREGDTIAEPARIELEEGFSLSDVQVVAYDEGYFFVAQGRFGEQARVIFGSFDESQEETIVYDAQQGNAAKLAATSRSSVFSEGQRLLRLEQNRRGFSFPFMNGCRSVIHGGERAFAWVDVGANTSAIWDVRLDPSEPFDETVMAQSAVPRVFPEEILGAAWDSEGERGMWLTGEVRAALGRQSLWTYDGEAPRRVDIETDERFVWLHGLALFEGRAMSFDLNEAPRLLLIEPNSGAILEEREVSMTLFENAGPPRDADLAAHANGSLANMSGVLVDFPADGEARVVFDENVDRRGQALLGHDVALRGDHAVTATGYQRAEGRSVVELRHFECR